MTFTELNLHYELYQADHTRGHLLCEACRTFAKQLISNQNPDCHEIVADAVMTAWEHFNMLPPDRIFAAWFISVVRNKTRKYHRKATVRIRKESAPAMYPESPFTLEQQHEMREKGGPLVNLLLDGHSIQEASATLGISTRVAKNRLKQLSEELNANV